MDGRWFSSQLQEMVQDWHERRFPEAHPEHVALKCAEELGEVASALNADLGRNSATGKEGDVPAEAADVVITMLVLVSRWYPGRDVLQEVERKLMILTDPTSGHSAAARA